MPIAPANGIDICYETFGSPDDPAMLLIRGLGSQMISWRDDFCARLVDEGFYVIRFDNRDVGLSTKFDDRPQYTLSDMAADAAGLLDHLGVDAVHVVGMSLGGMIAQVLAIEHPSRVLSLASIMSTVGGEDSDRATGEAAKVLATPAASTRDEAIARSIAERRVIASPGFPFGEAEETEIAGRSYDRCYLPSGKARQLVAATTAPSRKAELANLTMPAVVIHGTDDPLVPVDNGHRTAAAIPGAELVLIDGMGHDLPRGAWDTIIGAIVRTAHRAPART